MIVTASSSLIPSQQRSLDVRNTFITTSSQVTNIDRNETDNGIDIIDKFNIKEAFIIKSPRSRITKYFHMNIFTVNRPQAIE